MGSKKEQNIFADKNKYEGNIFKRMGHGIKNMKLWVKILIIILLIAIAAGLGVYGYVNGKLNKIEKVNLDETKLSCVDVDGYINILMLGVDSRDMKDAAGSRTDAIMIISINEKTWDVNLISVYRDTYLKMGDTDEYSKITNAFAFGGAENTISSLNQAMDLNIDKYIMVNFKAVSDLVNSVDGITVNVKDEEIQQLNKYTTQTANNIGQDDYKLVEKAGKQTLEGVQAVAYGRIRKGVGDDFKRTSRMRIVLSKVLTKLKQLDLSDLGEVLDLMLPQCQTNLSNNDIIGLAARATKYNIKKSTGWPYHVSCGWVGDASVVFADSIVPDVQQLHEKMFNQKDYQVSDSVNSISQYLAGIDKSGN